MRQFAIAVIFFVSFGLTVSAAAEESTINCHCFTDRSYDHRNPEKVIPYLLATTQNSFLSVAFKTPKFNLVKDLMAGIPSDHLWVSHYFAARFNYNNKSLQSLWQINGNWRDTLQQAGFSEQKLAPALITALQTSDDRKLAEAVVDEALLSLMGVDDDQLLKVRAAGADNREAILGFFLSRRTGQPATDIYESVSNGVTNWGTLAFVNNLQIGKMEQEFKALFN